MKVKNLEELISTFLGSENRLISCNSSNLLSSGENYGSVLLSIKIKYKDAQDDEKIANWVAKMAPPIQFLWDFFNTSVTFKKEVGVYKVIGPTLNQFGREKGIDNLIDIFAEYHGSRISVNPNAVEVDGDAVLLLENLKIEGYETKNRFVGFDYLCAKLLLKDMATLHASVIAFKLARPDEFKNKIRPFLSRDFFFDAGEEQLQHFSDTLKGVAEAANPACAEFFPRVEKKLINLTKSFRKPLNPKEPFATFVHGDFWVNNAMVKFENGIPVKHKMVDFQLMEYNSPANDVLFFLYSSVELPVLISHVDEFLETYHKHFIETLKKLDCDIGRFSYEAFMKECEEAAWDLQFAHLVFMHVPIFTQKGEAKEVSEFGSWATSDIEANIKKMHPICGDRLQFVIMDFVKRGWL